MGCTCVGLGSIIFSGLAVVLATIALGLPYWSSSQDVTNTNEDILKVEKSDFGAGVWGICGNVEFKPNSTSTLSLDNCYMFYSKKTFVVTGNSNEQEFEEEIASDSLCTLYNDDNRIAFDIMNNFGLEQSTLFEFLDKSCGGLGKGALATTVLGMCFGAAMFVILLLSITCCKKESCLTSFAASMGTLAFIFMLCSFPLWIAQSKPLHDSEVVGAKYSVSFYFAIFSTLFFLIATILSYKHMAKGRNEKKQEEEASSYQNAGAPPTATGTNLV